MGVSGGTAGSSKKEGDDGGEIRHGCKRSDYRRLLEGACEGRTEVPEVTRDLEIIESMLGEEVHGQSVLCGEYDLRGVRAGLSMPTLEYANQPATGLVLGLPQVPVQHGPGIHAKQRCGDDPNRRVLDLDTLDTWVADDISSTDEIWGAPVGEEVS